MQLNNRFRLKLIMKSAFSYTKKSFKKGETKKEEEKKRWKQSN